MEKYFSKGFNLKNVKVTDLFLGRLMDTVREEVIPYQWAALNDEVEGAAPSFCMRNFRVAAKLGERRRKEGQESLPVWPVDNFNLVPEDLTDLEDRFYGFVFQDTDFSKWIEAVGYSLTQHPDAELEKLADQAIDIVCAAQYEDGYLDTFYIINDPSKRFTNLRDHHELYCFGHLTEGAIAYYEATGKDKLLKAAMRFADFLVDKFGTEEGKCKGYPGHEIAEMALGRLYETTGEVKYLHLAEFFINERGKKPYYFDEERQISRKEGEEDYYYHQAHRPVREQDEAVGHAVRAVYLYTGMAQVAKYTGDEELKHACERLWNSIEQEKLYITGGIGGTPEGEAFSYPFHLPNDRMYNETCASIGLVFFARRMLEMSPKSCYADVMERAIYNGVISGMALDGKSFFYVNPMEVEPEGCKQDAHRKHVALPRQKWFGCACCPPNLNRMLSSVAQYAYSENDTMVFMHLYCGSELEKRFGNSLVKISVQSEYPWNEKIKIGFHMAEPTAFTYALRLPGWCENTQIFVNGERIYQGNSCPDKLDKAQPLDSSKMGTISVLDGYLYINREWKENDTVELIFEMKPVFYQADTRVRDDIGKVALMRGPVVYCAEEADNGAELSLLEVAADKAAEIKEIPCVVAETGEAVSLVAKGRRIKSRHIKGLYEPFQPYEYEPVEITYVPYYAWCNRGVGEMKTYLTAYHDK